MYEYDNIFANILTGKHVKTFSVKFNLSNNLKTINL